MMRFVLILGASALLGGGVGVGAKLFIGAGAPTDSAEVGHEAAASEGHGADEKHGETGDAGKKKAGKSKKKDGHGEASEAPSYLKFSRQFVVPLDVGRPANALMILDVNIELSPDIGEGAYALEPKLRDACFSTLLDLSASGALEDAVRSTESLQALKGALLDAARSILGDGARDVLITDIVVQAS
jgi:hypothetical protein